MVIPEQHHFNFTDGLGYQGISVMMDGDVIAILVHNEDSRIITTHTDTVRELAQRLITAADELDKVRKAQS